MGGDIIVTQRLNVTVSKLHGLWILVGKHTTREQVQHTSMDRHKFWILTPSRLNWSLPGIRHHQYR